MTWIPLESNPEVITKYARDLGLGTGRFEDVFGLDADTLSWVPEKCLAFLLLFPITPKYEEARVAEEETLKDADYDQSKIMFMKQTVGNACGTIGIIHAIANNKSSLEIKPDSALHNFIHNVKDKTPEQAAETFAQDEGIKNAHKAAGTEGQTEAPDSSEPINLHFVAIVESDGNLYELDGRKSKPVSHGTRSPDSFKVDAAKVCKKFMAMDETQQEFSILALCVDPS